jgi:4-amino-4-deoxy-L-arabinose transferase-like glycosyltransferase
VARTGVTTLGVIACLPRPLLRGRWDAAWHDRKEWRALVITSWLIAPASGYGVRVV